MSDAKSYLQVYLQELPLSLAHRVTSGGPAVGGGSPVGTWTSEQEAHYIGTGSFITRVS